MNKIPTTCQAYVRQTAVWYTGDGTSVAREIASDDIAMILGSRPSKDFGAVSLFKQAFANFGAQSLKGDRFDTKTYLVDATVHTREEFIAICTDQDIKKTLLEEERSHPPVVEVKFIHFGKRWMCANPETFVYISSATQD